MVNPHDVMFFQSDPIEQPEPNGAMNGLQTTKQRLGWFEQQWDVTLPFNFAFLARRLALLPSGN
jgi:hypothetical protein